MKKYTIESLDVWLMKLKGKERPIEEYPKSVRKTIRRIDTLAFKPSTVVRFHSKIKYDLMPLSRDIWAWLCDNAVGKIHRESDGFRFYLELESDAAWLKLVFIAEENL